MVECSKNAGIYLFMLHYIYEYTCAEYASRRRISRNMQVDICCNHVWRVGARCWGWGIALKMAKRSSEEFQKVSKVLCESPLDSPCIHLFFLNLSDSFSLPYSRSVPLFPFLLSSTMDCSCSISALAQAFSHINRLLYHVAPSPFRLTHYLFHTLITSWLIQYHVASSLGMRSQKLCPRN